MTATTQIAAAARKGPTKAVGYWLLAVCGLIFLMVLVGGATRLTDSGLSITEWRPVTGAIPPLSAEAWEAELEKYRQIPEYQLINRGMSLDEFKTIYWWEWGHRQLGRLIGLAFAIPFLFFLATGQLSGPLAWKSLALLILGGSQGALGWFMVQSGLADRVDVSQYRLAAHLTLALIIYAAVLWVALDVFGHRTAATPQRDPTPPLLVWGAGGFIALVFVQIILGGFVAGLDAGLVYNTWPSMNGTFVPQGAFAAGPVSVFEDHGAAQFAHRLTAYLVVAAGAGLWIWSRRVRAAPIIQKIAAAIALIGLAQMTLGIWTLVAQVPIGLGVAHQAGAVVLLTVSVFYLHSLARSGPGPAVVR